jgi:hypothetical protein
MSFRRLLTCSLLACAALATRSADAREDHLTVALAWRPTSDVNDLPSVFSPERWTHDFSKDTPPSDAFDGLTVQVLPFVDKRKEKDLGSNTEERWPRPILTNDDVAGFVSAHLGEVLQSAHVNVGDSGANRQLKGEVVRFFVTEDNNYVSTVLLQVTLTDAHGHELWQGTANGHSRRFGHSMSEENYNETLSDGLVDAVADLLKNHSFQRAVQGHAK